MPHRLDLDDLTAAGAHRRGHFRLSSGLHSADYLQCALYLAEPRRAERAGAALAALLGEHRPALVVSPALGGVIIGHEVARALGTPFLFTERAEGVMALRRGFALAPGQRVAVVEDVVTTGRSTREVMALVAEQGGEVVAVGAMVDRSGTANPFAPLPFAALVTVDFATWAPEACPHCAAGIPVEKPGSRPVGA